ncbi:MAG: putative sensor domain DACNV-containing protein [Vicinamibacterales bacterium]
MIDPRYPSARHVAPAVQAHFERMLAAPFPGTGPVPTLPTLADIEAVVDTAFWASLRREENYLPRISLALLPPDLAGQPLLFANPLPFDPVRLVRVAPAVERRGIHLGVWRDGDTLRVWGTTRSVPAHSLVLEVAGPGLLVIKHHRGDGGKFVNVAVLEADRILMIDDTAVRLPDCPAFVGSLLGIDLPGLDSPAGVMVELAVSMRAHGRGGMMIFVPSGTDAWRESIVQPVSYGVSPQYNGLATIVARVKAQPHSREWQDDLDDAVAAIAGLTAVDGATVMTDRYELLAFGAKIARRRGSALVEQTSLTEPIVGGEAAVLHPSALGGTRHLSAAQFVHDQRDTMALVASQDGRFTIFSWSPCEEMVHAHRVETLLL